jgi:non-ribosomal peptide synthetase component F
MYSEAVAVGDDGEHNNGEPQSLNYRELDHRTRVLSRALVASGLKSEDCVAVALHRSVSMVVALIAIQRAGGAFVALDPSHPAERKVVLDWRKYPIYIRRPYMYMFLCSLTRFFS